MLKKFALFYAGLDLALIAVCAYFGAIHILNSQLGLICAFLIALASFYGYAKRVKLKAQNAVINDIDDEIFDDEIDELSKNNYDEILTKTPNKIEQTPKTKPNFNDPNAKNPTKAKIPFSAYEFIGAFGPLRLAGYALLVLCFFGLLKNNLFEPISFLAGVAIMPFGALLANVLKD
ncbi:MAG: putative membrane protein [Candidatus Campylobacter infans]|nr:MAG: putative membrane protein [Candidatus Campylobacter infans]